MNSKLRIFISFLIALLGHLILFSIITIVFLIDPEVPKPKLFFLGPILSQSDVKRKSVEQNTSIAETKMKNPALLDTINTNKKDSGKNPFTIQSISKPLSQKAEEEQDKTLIKSTFEANLDKTPDVAEPSSEIELDIRPYRSLQFQPIQSNNSETTTDSQ